MVVLPIVALVLSGFWLASRYIRPAPPNTLVISTGAPGGAYQYYASLYRPILARSGIELREWGSEGSMDNLQRLKDRSQEVDVAFVQGGTAAAFADAELYSLGGLTPEPLWVFYRHRKNLDRVSHLKGLRIAIGPDGSGVNKLARDLMGANGVSLDAQHIVEEGGLQAVEAIQRGQVDAVFLVGAARSGPVWALLHTPGVKLMSFARADAYVRLFPFLEKVQLPAGGIDLAKNIPAKNVQLVAATMTMVVRDETHPALVSLLMEAAHEVHGRSGLFQKPHEYPKSEPVDLPLSSVASHYFKSGPPLLQRYLPFWAATLVDRMMVMLIPVVALLLPLLKIAPGLYTWRVRSRIFRYYGELKFLEAEMENEFGKHSPDEWESRLNRLETMVRHLQMPKAFMDQIYTLRGHINWVRQLLARKTAESQGAVGP